MRGLHGQKHQRHRPSVAFLGPFSSYTHQAAKLMFPGEDAYELEPVPMINDVFESVRLGQTTYGVVPFENSTYGPVMHTLAALADRDQVYGSLVVCDEVYLAVHHCLLGRPQQDKLRVAVDTSSTTDGEGDCSLNRFDHITRLYSHPQAFGQTGAFVRAHLPVDVEMIETSSTSRAAELAAADETSTSAAISSEQVAKTVGLDVLARCIEDRKDNTTRFYVLRLKEELLKRSSAPQQTAANGEVNTNDINNNLQHATQMVTNNLTTDSKSLVSFTVPHHNPGALADALDCFRRMELNLTSINSLPSLVQPFQYLFLIEFEPNQTTTTGSSRNDILKVQRALDDLASVAESWRFWGTWKKYQ